MRLFRFAQNTDEGWSHESAIIVNSEIHRFATAGDADVLAVRLPAAMLSLSAECQVSLTSRPQFQHYVAREIAVSAFELSSAGCVDDTQANQGGCDSDSFPRV